MGPHRSRTPGVVNGSRSRGLVDCFAADRRASTKRIPSRSNERWKRERGRTSRTVKLAARVVEERRKKMIEPHETEEVQQRDVQGWSTHRVGRTRDGPTYHLSKHSLQMRE